MENASKVAKDIKKQDMQLSLLNMWTAAILTCTQGQREKLEIEGKREDKIGPK